MNGFELVVNERAPDQRGKPGRRIVQVGLPLSEGLHHCVGRWWDEHGVIDPGPPGADPVLRPAEFPGSPLRPSDSRHENLVELSNEPETEWQALNPFQPIVEGPDVVPHLLHVGGARGIRGLG